jgi:hypothetical protein
VVLLKTDLCKSGEAKDVVQSGDIVGVGECLITFRSQLALDNQSTFNIKLTLPHIYLSQNQIIEPYFHINLEVIYFLYNMTLAQASPNPPTLSDYYCICIFLAGY